VEFDVCFQNTSGHMNCALFQEACEQADQSRARFRSADQSFVGPRTQMIANRSTSAMWPPVDTDDQRAAPRHRERYPDRPRCLVAAGRHAVGSTDRVRQPRRRT
jgi:hypothetical protein